MDISSRHRNCTGGDASLAQQAQAYYCQTLGLDPRFASRYNGVSIYPRPDGSLMVRVVLQNFFTDQVDVRVHDYPYIIYTVCAECGGQVCLRPADNDFLTIPLRGYLMSVAIPNHILVQKCATCGEVYVSQTEYDRISEQMIKELS